MGPQKPIHTIVLDAGPFIRNDPEISTLLATSEELVTVPAVLSEIKDQDARSRIDLSWKPFISVKSPAPGSVKVITNFATKTGDIAVLSKTDIQVLALSYETECERNGGDWRLRSVPGQKRINGLPPKKQDGAIGESELVGGGSAGEDPSPTTTAAAAACEENARARDLQEVIADSECPSDKQPIDADIAKTTIDINKLSLPSNALQENGILGSGHLNDRFPEVGHLSNGSCETDDSKLMVKLETTAELSHSDSEDSEEWITPSNIKKHLARDMNSSTLPMAGDVTMQVATITTDFAMQNVLLHMNLNILSPGMQRVQRLKTHVLRCHACFATFKPKEPVMQFCSRCGKPTLTRVSCSTSQKGKFMIHLKKNMQWNHRGDRFSIPKPVSGAANAKPRTGKGGGKGGWGQELILAEDQKEHLRAMTVQSRRKNLDLMDQDYLPGILTGDRGNSGGRPKIGAGRNINSRRR